MPNSLAITLEREKSLSDLLSDKLLEFCTEDDSYELDELHHWWANGFLAVYVHVYECTNSALMNPPYPASTHHSSVHTL